MALSRRFPGREANEDADLPLPSSITIELVADCCESRTVGCGPVRRASEVPLFEHMVSTDSLALDVKRVGLEKVEAILPGFCSDSASSLFRCGACCPASFSC
jgi:hypothetical protein